MALKSRRRLQGAAEGVGQKRTADALASFRDILRSCRSGISRKTWCTFPSGDQRKSRCYNVRGKDTPMRSLHRGEPPRQEFASDLDEIARQGARKMLIQKPERAKGRASSHRPRIVVDGLVPWRLGELLEVGGRVLTPSYSEEDPSFDHLGGYASGLLRQPSRVPRLPSGQASEPP